MCVCVFIHFYTCLLCCRCFSELKEHTMLTGVFQAVGIDPATSPALESLLLRSFL